jgi:hypothetical protein
LLYLALTLFCAVVAFMPRSNAARWLDIALAPSRVLGELASPIGMIARREARAAVNSLLSTLEQEHAQSVELAVDERLFALPDENRLIGSRLFAHAQVLHRVGGALDLLECQMEERIGPDLVVDLPVVFSNHYIGRVAAVDAARGRIRVILVTHAGFRVGASVVPAAPQAQVLSMVVGGVESSQHERIALAVHNPERAEIAAGEVRVDERLNPHAPFRELSDGFRLGRMELSTPGRPAVQSEIDFSNGLFRVVIVLPPNAAERVPASDIDVFADVHWRPVNAFSTCEPSAWREGLKIDYPRGSGARDSAAVVAGARLVGRIAHAGALSSDVALLGDRGLSLHVLAKIEGEVAPLGLGRLVSLGREHRGAPVRFRWTSKLALKPQADGTPERDADLFTGAGELGVPRGLLIGKTKLPCAVGEYILEVEQGFDARLMPKLWIWRGIEQEELETQRLP